MYKKNDIITTDRYLDAFPNIYFKTDTVKLHRSVFWRNKIVNPPPKNLNIIITGHSDYDITDELVDFYNPKIWWTVNKNTNRNNVLSLPLGITNDSNEGPLYYVYGNLDIMIEVMNEPKNDKNLIYMNFNIDTYKIEREKIYNKFKDFKYVTIGNIENTIDGRKKFLREIRNHTFVLCPRGNGIDTHRLWETLYMGSIPIIKKEICYSDFFDLPICFVNDWNDINEDFLAKEKDRILKMKWNKDKLKISYWINLIKVSLHL